MTVAVLGWGSLIWKPGDLLTQSPFTGSREIA